MRPNQKSFLLVASAALLQFSEMPVMAAEAITLRSLGAKGDGQTDDRAILEKALRESAGKPLDGEGLTYAVDGNIDLNGPVDLQNAILKQTAGSFDTTPFIRSAKNTQPPVVKPAEALRQMVRGLPLLRHDGVATYAEDPEVTGADREALRRMLNVRTLFIHGSEGKPVSVRLEKVKVLRGPHADAGMHSNSAGLYVVHAAPLTLKQVEITGDGKGSGLFVNGCQKVLMDAVHIHDIHWAPYRGDVDFSAAELAADFGWNNSPIYDFNDRTGRFIRVRVQEQLTGLTLTQSEDVEIINSRIERIGTRIEGRFEPWQADGATISGVKNLTMRHCVISQVWEGIDFTGKGVDGFLQEDIHISDTFAYGFKYAHPQKNGRVVNCTSTRAGFKSFIIGSECENIEFIGCTALETGVDSRWKKPDRERNGISGFELDFDAEHTPRHITLRDCRAENVTSPNQMDFGFLTSDRARDPALGIRLINPTAKGAKHRDVDGFRAE